MSFAHRCLTLVMAFTSASAFAQLSSQCVMDGAASANGSGIVYIEYEIPGPVANSCATNFSSAKGAGLVLLQYDIPPPSNVQATDGAHIGKVVVSWATAVPGAKYYIFRDGQPIGPIGGTTSTSFEDLTAEGYKTYSYTVAVGQDGGISEPSAPDTGYGLAKGASLNLAASDGTVTDRIDLSWSKIQGADGYKIFRNNVLIATLAGDTTTDYSDITVAGSAAKITYAVSAYKGTSETSKSQDQGYANQPPAEVSGTILVPMDRQSDPFVPTVVDPNLPDDSFLFEIAEHPINGTVSITNNQILYTPNYGFQGEDSLTVQAMDRAGALKLGVVSVRIDCPRPLIYGVNVSGDLTSMEGLALVEACGTPAQTQVRLEFVSGGKTVRDVSIPLTKLEGSNKYYSFSDSISGLPDGAYTVSATLTDSYNHTATFSKPIIIDWNAAAAPKFTYKGSQIYTGGTTAESLGNVGVK